VVQRLLLFINRNKRAIAVDMAKPDGAAALRRLAVWADVWVENFRPGALDRIGSGTTISLESIRHSFTARSRASGTTVRTASAAGSTWSHKP
jgi:crotonobetainyl-CoA:carnitine CoA-transferase CaiB-like acyl-CoA transferase